ncbi:MAG: dimethylarginine dimethylaminohydrolase family protein [Parvularculaceae bacterium]
MSAAHSVYRFDAAIVRRPAPSVAKGLRAADRGDPEFAALSVEHDAYVVALEAAGVTVTPLPALDGFPDSVFVEDPALVFPEGAILLRPGAPGRAGEVAAIAPALRDRFDVVLTLPAPGFVEGGDVLVTPGKAMIGLSSRTDRAGAEALCACLAELGHNGEIVETPAEVLHFKTDCSLLDDETVLTTVRLARSGVFRGMNEIIVPQGEDPAANALRINDTVLIGADFSRTAELLDKHDYKVVGVPTTEIGKIDAGLSCMSLRWRRAA